MTLISVADPACTLPPPFIGENIFLNEDKLTSFSQPKCGLRPRLLHILDPPLDISHIVNIYVIFNSLFH